MKNVKDSAFQEELADKNYIIDFFATWCGPCKAVAPILESVETETGIPIYKVDTDEFDDLAAKYGVRAIPMVAFFKDGQLVDTISGSKDRQTYLAAANKLIEN